MTDCLIDALDPLIVTVEGADRPIAFRMPGPKADNGMLRIHAYAGTGSRSGVGVAGVGSGSGSGSGVGVG